MGSEPVRLELKYCECCGGLLLRRAGTPSVYCAGCAAKLKQVASGTVAKRRGRPPKSERVELQAMAAMAGWRETARAAVAEAGAWRTA